MASTVKKNTVRILHCGDAWLDSPFEATTAAGSEKRRAEVRQTFKSIFDFIAKQKIDLVLFSGNLFDIRYATGETATRLFSGIAGCPQTRFFISPGPSDPYTQESIYAAFDAPENLHIFTQNAIRRVEVPELGLAVCGWACTDPDDAFLPLAHGLPKGEADCCLLCGYATTDPKDPISLSVTDLATSGAVYAALSTGGNYLGFQHIADTVYAASGSPEARGFAYDDFGGINLLLLRRGKSAAAKVTEEKEAAEDENAQKEDKPLSFSLKSGSVSLTVRRVRCGCRRYVTLPLDVSPYRTAAEIEAQVRRLIGEGEYGKDTSVRVIYEGHTGPELTPPPLTEKEICAPAEFFTLDRSLPDKDEQGYTRDMSIKGELVRAMSPAFAKKDENGRQTAAKALRFTFSALDNQDTSHI